MAELFASFERVDITPRGPVSLAGYFNDRRSEGVLDPLHCHLAAFRSGRERVLFVQIDTCLIKAADVERLKARIAARSDFSVGSIMVLASHTHTAPALTDFYGVRREESYLEELFEKAATAAGSLGSGVRVEARAGRARAPGLASNRRWYMADGRVVTNPPRAHPAIVRPEGPVDDEVNIVSFEAEGGGLAGLFVSVSNHCDTIGGSEVSADWPGIMEAELRAALGRDTVVMPFIGAAGNINHFDFSRVLDQSNYAETGRLGRAYAAAAREAMAGAVPVSAAPLAVRVSLERMAPVEVSAEELAKARELLRAPAPDAGGRNLTAEDIFAGDPAVERLFAGALLELVEGRPGEYAVPLQLIRLGKIGFFAIPGEPFVEIGLELKRLPGFDLCVPVGLANGYLGYIPLEECFSRGGYEVRPGPAVLSRKAAGRIITAFREMADRAPQVAR